MAVGVYAEMGIYNGNRENDQPGSGPTHRSEARHQFLDLPLDEVADLAVLLRRHLLGVGYLPLLTTRGSHPRTLVATAHRDGHVDLAAVEVVERLRRVGCQVVADLLHELDGARVDLARRL